MKARGGGGLVEQVGEKMLAVSVSHIDVLGKGDEDVPVPFAENSSAHPQAVAVLLDVVHVPFRAR